MKKLYAITATAALAALAAFGFTATSVAPEGTAFPKAGRIVAIEAVSTNKSGSATLKVVRPVSLAWDVTTVTTNTSYTTERTPVYGFTTNVEETITVSDGFRRLAVNAPIAVSTNLVGVGTNVITITQSGSPVYCATNSAPYSWTVSTNKWMVQTRTWKTVTQTNKVPVVTTTRRQMSFAATNTLGTVTCSGGYGVVTNLSAFVKDGDIILGTGTAFKGGKVTVYTE